VIGIGMKTLTAEQVCDLAEAGELKKLLECEGPLTMTLDGEAIATLCPTEGEGPTPGTSLLADPAPRPQQK